MSHMSQTIKSLYDIDTTKPQTFGSGGITTKEKMLIHGSDAMRCSF